MNRREWNPKAFFRKVSEEALLRFEREHQVVLKRNEEDPPGERTYRAWMRLAEKERTRLETLLLPVNDLCSAHGRPYLDQLARQQWAQKEKLIEQSKDWSSHDLALRLFVEENVAFLRLYQTYAVDMFEHFREFVGKRPLRARATASTKNALKGRLQKYFRGQAGGNHCAVEDHETAEKLYLLVYHEGQVDPREAFDEAGVLTTLWDRRVLQTGLVFEFATSTLLVKAANKEDRGHLRNVFAEVYAADPSYFEEDPAKQRFDFAPLLNPEFEFPTHSADRIVEVSVVGMDVKRPTSAVSEMKMRLAGGLSSEGVTRALTELNVPVDAEKISGVQIRFRFEGQGNAQQRTASIRNPGTTNLRETQRDRIIRKYLREWRIDVARSRFDLDSAA